MKENIRLTQEQDDQDRASIARMAWLSLVGVIGFPHDADFDKVCEHLSRAPSHVVAAVQFIMLGSGEHEAGLVATGAFDLASDGPSLSRLYGAAGGSSFR